MLRSLRNWKRPRNPPKGAAVLMAAAVSAESLALLDSLHRDLTQQCSDEGPHQWNLGDAPPLEALLFTGVLPDNIKHDPRWIVACDALEAIYGPMWARLRDIERSIPGTLQRTLRNDVRPGALWSYLSKATGAVRPLPPVYAPGQEEDLYAWLLDDARRAIDQYDAYVWTIYSEHAPSMDTHPASIVGPQYRAFMRSRGLSTCDPADTFTLVASCPAPGSQGPCIAALQNDAHPDRVVTAVAAGPSDIRYKGLGSASSTDDVRAIILKDALDALASGEPERLGLVAMVPLDVLPRMALLHTQRPATDYRSERLFYGALLDACDIVGLQRVLDAQHAAAIATARRGDGESDYWPSRARRVLHRPGLSAAQRMATVQAMVHSAGVGPNNEPIVDPLQSASMNDMLGGMAPETAALVAANYLSNICASGATPSKDDMQLLAALGSFVGIDIGSPVFRGRPALLCAEVHAAVDRLYS